MSHRFEFSHDVETVYSLMTDPQFLVDRSLALGELSADCEVEEDDESATVTMSREVKRDLPAFLAKLFNPVQSMHMTEEWQRVDDGFSGHYHIDVQGQPVTIDAEFTLKPGKKGCIYTIDYTCKARIPMVGRKVEQFIIDQAKTGVTAEMAYLKKQLG
ncbi:MAG: DUF2505 domain-containing protein [Gammaproteobacteria bacterium]|nr:MAG: DUF2505 domain-containing protein [Gammaproteobacteria bacterium]